MGRIMIAFLCHISTDVLLYDAHKIKFIIMIFKSSFTTSTIHFDILLQKREFILHIDKSKLIFLRITIDVSINQIL